MNISFSKNLTIRAHADVLVVGGGPAGIGAAIAASRNKARTCLIEQRGFLGGNITGSYVLHCNWFLGGRPIKITGIYTELEAEYQKKYGVESAGMRQEAVPYFHSECLKVFLDEIMEKERVDVILDCFGTDSIVQEGKIKGVVIDSKCGLEVILADIVIDATGDGDVAARAGVPFEMGREEDGFCQPGTLNFRVAGVNTEKVVKLLDRHGRNFYSDIVKEAQQRRTSGLSCPRPNAPFNLITRGGQVMSVNFSDVYKIDPTDIKDLTYAEVKARQQIMEMLEFMRKNFPGFENCEISSFAPVIGFRDSRRIRAEYKLTSEDIDSGTEFADTIAVYPAFYDMLSPSGNWDDNLLTGTFKPYSIPYRCLVPINVDNLLVAGRCIYTDHKAEASIRAISACMATGEAAGTAASLCSKGKFIPRELDVINLQYQLKKQGVKLEKW